MWSCRGLGLGLDLFGCSDIGFGFSLEYERSMDIVVAMIPSHLAFRISHFTFHIPRPASRFPRCLVCHICHVSFVGLVVCFVCFLRHLIGLMKRGLSIPFSVACSLNLILDCIASPPFLSQVNTALAGYK